MTVQEIRKHLEMSLKGKKLKKEELSANLRNALEEAIESSVGWIDRGMNDLHHKDIYIEYATYIILFRVAVEHGIQDNDGLEKFNYLLNELLKVGADSETICDYTHDVTDILSKRGGIL